MLTVPERTLSPGVLLINVDSPLINDSSTSVVPEITSPSIGIISPGLITTISPLLTAFIGMIVSFLCFSTKAIFG